MNSNESEVVEVKNVRKGISKKLRMEIFKRDSFKCGYCGKSAPDVILHIDHIKPVSKDGDNHPLNLITACHDCNAGKSNVLLDDKSTLSKQKKQLDLLQEKREQQEMMFEWQEALLNIDKEKIDRIASYWNQHTPELHFPEGGKHVIKQWLKRYSLEEILVAMDAAARSYLKYSGDGKCTADSWVEAVNKIPNICGVKRAKLKNPDLEEMLKLRYHFSKRAIWFKPHQYHYVLDLIKLGRERGISFDRLYAICDASTGVSALYQNIIGER